MNRAQIKVKINQKKAQQKNVQNEKKSYQDLLTNTNRIINELNNSLNQMYSAQGYLRNGYRGNSRNKSGVLTEDTIRKVEIIKKELNNTVNPAINSKIRELTRQINNLNTEINRLWQEYYKVSY